MNDDKQEATAPTLFEWAGGAPALLRMTTIFYGTYVPDDPLLGPLFAEMAPDHPERVAAWLGEVFGGPRSYTERFGDYDRMISRHLGRALSEEQRARWVQLLCRSADDAGLPMDPEWRAAFVAYLEWGSRIALENSQQAPSRRPTCRSRIGRGLPTRRPAREFRRSPSRRHNTKPTFPGLRRSSASRSTSSRSSVRGIAVDALRIRPLVA